MLYLTGYGLTLDDLEAVPPVGQPHAGPPRGAPHRRASRSRPARSARASPTASAWASPSAGCGPASAPSVCRPPHLRDLRRRRPRGGHQPRGRVAGRPPRPRPARLRLRRQPHHHRRPDRAGADRRRRRSASRPTAGTSTTSARSPTTSTRSRRRSAGPWPSRTSPSLIVLRSHIGYPSPKYTDTRGPRQPARRRRDRASPRRSWACRRTRRSGCPTTCSSSTARPAAAGRGRARGLGGAARRPGPATAAAFDAVPRRPAASPGWEDEAPDLGPSATRSPPARPAAQCLNALRRRRARAHGRRRRPHRQHRHRARRTPASSPPTRPAAARSTSASASTAWAAIMNGMALHGGALPGRRHVPRLQRLHARRGAPRRAVARPRSSTRGPTTRSASARTGPPTSRSSTWPSLRAMPGLRVIRPADANETADGLARRRRPRRPHRADPDPPEPAGARGHGRQRRRARRAPTCCATPTARRPTSCSSAPAARCRSALDAAELLAADGHRAPGSCRCPAGSCSTCQDDDYQDAVLPAGVPTLAVEAGVTVRLGAAGPTTRSASTTSGPARPATPCSRSSASPPTTWPNGPRPVEPLPERAESTVLGTR